MYNNKYGEKGMKHLHSDAKHIVDIRRSLMNLSGMQQSFHYQVNPTSVSTFFPPPLLKKITISKHVIKANQRIGQLIAFI